MAFRADCITFIQKHRSARSKAKPFLFQAHTISMARLKPKRTRSSQKEWRKKRTLKGRTRRVNYLHVGKLGSLPGIQMAQNIIRGAEVFFKMNLKPTDRIIFVGQRMYPFFESVWALNEHYRAFSRKQVRYFVAPKYSVLQGSMSNSVFQAETTAKIILRLREQKALSPRVKRYFVVDLATEHEASTPYQIKKAIESALPHAQAVIIDQNHKNKLVGEAVRSSDCFPAPTQKSDFGETVRKWSDHPVPEGNFYLLIRELLHEHIAQKAEKKVQTL